MYKPCIEKGIALVACTAMLLIAFSATADVLTIDGSGNNLADSLIGAAGTQLQRIAPSDYGDGLSTPAGATRPSAREISNQIFDQSTSIPDTRNLSNFVWAWGQFVDHDIDLTPGHSPANSFNITVPTGDPHFDPFHTGSQTIPLDRSIYDTATGTSSPREQVNVITSWLDGSNVYGSDITRANALRSFAEGKLKTTAHATGDMLPFNTPMLPNAGGTSPSLLLAGDIRANENVVLSSLHTLFVREHNNQADEIALSNPTWTDEQVYQRARKIVGAEIQSITYNQFLPALGVNLADYTGYDSSLDAGITNEFSTAAYRFGHSMLSSVIDRLNETGQTISEGDLPLLDAFFRPDSLFNEGGIDPLLRGLASSNQQATDAKIIDDVRNFLFGPPGAGGLDLAALNIQRGRDHGLTDYNMMRQAYGLSAVLSFSDITSDTALAGALSALYGSVDDIDAWVGLLAEDPMSGSSIGETVAAILAKQFGLLRDGDRFFYLNDSDFTALELAALQDTSLSDIIIDNTEIGWMQNNVFFYVTRTPEPGTALLAILGVMMIAARRPRREMLGG